MNALTVLQDLAARPIDALETFSARLAPARLNAHPGGHDNSPAWLLWHTGREFDLQIAHLAGQEQVWAAQGYDARLGLGALDPNDIGYGHTPQ